MRTKFFVAFTAATFTALALSTVALAGQFTGDCDNSANNYFDPIVKPDVVNGEGHLHNFFGATTFNNDSTWQQLEASPTTCDRPSNHSLYWAPQLVVVENGTNKQHDMPAFRTGVYYQDGGLNNVKPFPRGFKTIAESVLTAPQNPEKRAQVFWHCNRSLNIAESKQQGRASPPLTSDPTCVSTGTFGVTITFPNCWDGQDFSTTPRGANVRHDKGGTSCPSSHPKELPQLNMPLDYDIPRDANNAVVQGKIMVNDGDGALKEPSGMHADYFNSEDQTDLTQRCINLNENSDFCRHDRRTP